MFKCCLQVLLTITSIFCFTSANSSPSGSWQPLVNQPNFVSYDLTDPNNPVSATGGANMPLLMTDGGVLVQNIGTWATSEIWKLTPDKFGSYVNGTWSQLASLPYTPYSPGSAVLADGRVIVTGGEYTDWDFKFTLTNQCAIFNPVKNIWTAFSGPPFFCDLYYPRTIFAPNPIGDSATVILEDGTFMLEDKMSTQAALLDLKTLTWRPTGAATKAPYWNDEEGLTLLPNGKVLTVNCYTQCFFMPEMYPYPDKLTHSQIYNPKTGKWKNAGSTIHSLTDIATNEMGPAILRPNGTVFAMGASGNSSIYNYRKKKWSLGPILPLGPGNEGQLGCQDAPGALLTNGNVLFAASPINPPFSPPAHFFVFDGQKFFEQPTIPNAQTPNPSSGIPDAAFNISLLLLPTGQVLAVDGSNDVEIYTSDDMSYNSKWIPVISDCPKTVKPNSTYKIKGIRFNGMSQACAFGDELQCATNYPLVRITNKKSGHVFYCRTHDHSFMGVASNKEVFTYFDVPSNIEIGKSELEVVANGIPSKPISIRVKDK